MLSARNATALVLLVAAQSSFLVQDAQALTLNVQRHSRQSSSKRSLDQRSPAPLTVNDLYDLYYGTSLTIGGQELSVQLDTGSSELWVRPAPSFTPTAVTTTNTSIDIRYGVGSFNGTLTTATVVLGDVTIQNQAFLAYTSGSIDNVFQAGLDGMLGLGFDDGSHVESTVRSLKNDDSGQTLLSNYFDANPSEPRTMTFAMSRNGDPESGADGLFMIGTPESQYSNVTSAPSLGLYINTNTNDFQRWSTFLDAIEVNGVNVTNLTSVVSGAPSGRLVANMDTGTSLAWVPSNIVDAIYKNLNGATYYPASDQYEVDCMSSPRVALWFSGQRFPIHPLDLTRVSSTTDSGGNKTYYCTNAFIHTSALSSQSSELDMQLGDSFLRNVIAQYDFGTGSNDSSASIRMVTTITDELAALNDFNVARASQIGIAAPASSTTLPGGSPTTTSSSSTGTTKTVSESSSTEQPTPTAAPGTGDTNGDSDSSDGSGSSNGSGSTSTSTSTSADGGALTIFPAHTLVISVLSILLASLL